ncbi:MAG: hypothetical protein QG656_1710 [Candidatus Hydrogenedentes bacterium]|nr:hypothetical protein [Candidatus Hydrogenedentota bacterium]
MKNLAWFIAAGLVLGLTFLVKSPYLAFSVYAFLLLIVVARFSSFAWLAGLDCERTLSLDTVAQGEEVDVSVTVTNRRGWPIPWIFLEDRHPADTPRKGENTRLAILMPGRSVTMNYRLQFPRRGYHRIGPMIMESGDLFGLQKRFRTGRQQDYVSVLPTVAYIETFNVASRRPQGPVRISNRVYEDPTRIANIREYVPGDPMRNIHWKASARTGTLHVKTCEASSVLGGTLILDLHQDSYFPPETADIFMELAVTTTASIAYLLQMSGEQVGMLTNARDAAEVAKYDVRSKGSVSRQDADAGVEGEDESTRLSPLQVPTMRSPIQAQRVIENLARVVPTDGLMVRDLIMSEFNRLPRDAALLPVVPFMDEQLALTLASMKLSGFNVSVFLVGNEVRYQEAAKILAQHEIYVFHIEEARNLHEISPDRIGQ